MKGILVFIFCYLVAFEIAVTAEASPEIKIGGHNDQQVPSSVWPVGDARRCQDLITDSRLKVKRFEVMPGLGWDNLRNLEASQVMSFNYSKCHTTDDGVFLIPDNVFTVPLKTSSIDTLAEMITHWTQTSSTTSQTINVNAGLKQIKYTISGSFSHDYAHLKSTQIGDKSVTIRTQIRYNRYEAKLQPDSELSPQFRERVKSIAVDIMLNETAAAHYKAQLLVRDFGTHVITSVTAGAGLVKDDYVDSKFVKDHSDKKTSILAAASATFVQVFNIGASFKHQTDQTIEKTYNSSVTHSFISSHGGNLLVAGHSNITDWTSSVGKNMVTMDRAGDPLYFFITPQAFPEIPPTTVSQVETTIRHAVELYYKMNTIPGCTKIDSPNFSVSANFDDKSCDAKFTNTTFGGVYQTCTLHGPYLHKNPCEDYEQVNPMTGKYSCPTNFRPVLLHSSWFRESVKSDKKCHRCRLFWTCCTITQYRPWVQYKAYWCAATKNVQQDSGYLFGGLFTSSVPNGITGTRDCPNSFYARRLFSDLNICISDDFELGSGSSVPFGGFFSCSMGNPLAAEVKPKAHNNLYAFLGQRHVQTTWPKRCPTGYSAHMAGDDKGCSIHYCVGSGALSGPTLPPVKLPPYMLKPPALVFHDDNLVMFDADSGNWMRNKAAVEFQAQNATNQSVCQQVLHYEQSQTLTPGIAGVVGAVTTLACVSLLIVGYIIFSRVRATKKTAGREPSRETTSEGYTNQAQCEETAVASLSERV